MINKPDATKKKFRKLSLVVSLCLLLVTVKQVFADRLESSSYVITFGNFNVTSGEKSSASYTVTDTVGQTADGPYGEYGSSTYFVGSGFQYIYQVDQFGFSISDTSIDFGELTLDTHHTDSNVISISAAGAGGYTVYAYEQHPLRHTNGSDIIVDTTCDNSDCDETTATVWTNNSVAGFGFNMTGDDIPSDFINSTYYRQFANDEDSESMKAVMSGSNIGTYDATVTYKVGINSSQLAGDYQTTIVFVAVPNY